MSDGTVAPPTVLLSPRNASIAAELASRFGNVHVCTSNQAVVDGASTMILCLRPQDAPEVLRTLHFPTEQSIISVMAGISIEALRPLVAPATAIARCIPLPSVASREGVTVILPPGGAAKALFDPLGGTIELQSQQVFNAFSAATATVAAHFEYLDTISRWLAAKGVSPDDAVRYIASVFIGLTPTMRSGESFQRLAQDHTTPGGINELFLDHLRRHDVYRLVNDGLQQVSQKITG
jgi:pyrroline-5-carboxylate reductase